MTLRHLLDDCTELADLTSSRWTRSSIEEHTALLARAREMQEKIRHTSGTHNSAVLKTMRRHHPDQPHMQPDKLKDAVEHLQTDWEMIAIPSDVTCLNRLPETEREERLIGLPAEVALLYRFAIIVRNQVGTLLMEAEEVHALNRQGAHVERIPSPTDTPVESVRYQA